MEPTLNPAMEPITVKDGGLAPGEALEAFGAGFLDPVPCRRWLLERLHPEGAVCPKCGARIRDAGLLRTFWSGQRLRCQACGKYFTAVTGTLLSGSHLGFRRFLLMLVLMSLELDNRTVAGMVGCSQETVRLWHEKLHWRDP